MTATVKTETAPSPAALDENLGEHLDAAEDRALRSVQPLTPEELTDRLTPSDPRLSPDGRAVLFAVAPRGKKGEHKEQAIWISRDGTPARPFIGGTAHDANARWSPDGTQILFCSDRAERGDENSKLYLIDATGGEARPLGDLQGELTMPSWSPDGRSVALLRKDPETPDEK